MRRAAKADANQTEIADALRKVGASVEFIHRLGSGIPDLLVGYRQKNYLLEVKDGTKSASRRQLTADEETWHRLWRGQVATIHSFDEAWVLISGSDSAVARK